MSRSDTVTELAQLLDVNRRRISKWRKENNAPESLEHEEWRAWFLSTGRTKFAARLPSADEQHEIEALASGQAPDGRFDDPPTHINGTPLSIDEQIKRERLIDQRRERQVRDRDLIHVGEVAGLLGECARFTAETYQQVSIRVRTALDGLTSEDRRIVMSALQAELRSARKDVHENTKQRLARFLETA